MFSCEKYLERYVEEREGETKAVKTEEGKTIKDIAPTEAGDIILLDSGKVCLINEATTCAGYESIKAATDWQNVAAITSDVDALYGIDKDGDILVARIKR